MNQIIMIWLIKITNKVIYIYDFTNLLDDITNQLLSKCMI